MDQAAAHSARLAPFVEPHLERRRLQIKHPIHDFLFTYYSYRPAQLTRWQPPEGLNAAKRPFAEATLKVLRATAGRGGNFGCFGLHEWAMVYRDPETRHPQPLRLGAAETDKVVESHRIGCSHWDAFRFFTPAAVSLNTIRPFSDDRADFEQPSCLHANMDLYKWGYKLLPAVSSELVTDAFELSWRVRTMDMQASPYDLSEWGYSPIRIEDPQGKAEYVAAQRGFAEEAAALRARLLQALRESALLPAPDAA